MPLFFCTLHRGRGRAGRLECASFVKLSRALCSCGSQLPVNFSRDGLMHVPRGGGGGCVGVLSPLSKEHAACLTMKLAMATVCISSFKTNNKHPPPQTHLDFSPWLSTLPPRLQSPPFPPIFSSPAGAQDVYLTHSGNQREASEKPALPKAEEEFINGQDWGRVGGTGESPGIKAASVASPGSEEWPVGSRAQTSVPVMAAGSLGRSTLKGNISATGQADPSGGDPLKELASSVESKFALLTNPRGEPAQPPPKLGYPHASATGEAAAEKESPESPFEVIADQLEFDKEFKEVLTDIPGHIGSNWVVHGEREMLTDIPEDSVCEFRAKPRSGARIPPGLGLSRQSSGTTAALEEVSKCVREMHSFTNELLNWDLIPKDLGDPAGEEEEAAAAAAPAGGPPASSPRDAGPGLAGLKAGILEVGKAPAPRHPVTVSVHPKSRLPPEAERAQPLARPDAGVGRTASAGPKPGASWPNPGLPEALDADSSSESDDTVIEDAAGELGFQSEKPSEGGRASKAASSPATEAAQTKGEGALSQTAGPRPEGSLGATQAEAGVLGASPPAVSKPGREPGARREDFVGKQSGAKGPPVSPPSLPSDKGKTTVSPGAAKAESFMDFMKECLKSEGNGSPEDPVETFSEAELRAARSHVAAPSVHPAPPSAPDFEQERLTIKALKEAGRKADVERLSSAPGRSSLAGGRPSGHYVSISAEPPAPAQRSALEKRPLCLEEAVDVKLAPGPASFGAHGVASKPSRGLSPEPPLPHMVKKLLAEFSGKVHPFYLAPCTLHLAYLLARIITVLAIVLPPVHFFDLC